MPEEFVYPKEVLSRDGTEVGEVRGRRRCQMEGCTGIRIRVKWADGKVTFPCSKGMKVRNKRKRVWQIL